MAESPVRRGFLPQAELVGKEKLLPVRKILEAHSGELAIGDRDHCSVQRADPGGTQADALHRAADVSRLAEIADTNRLIGDRREFLPGFGSICSGQGTRPGPGQS